jgi:hypothetical protein
MPNSDVFSSRIEAHVAGLAEYLSLQHLLDRFHLHALVQLLRETTLSCASAGFDEHLNDYTASIMPVLTYEVTA